MDACGSAPPLHVLEGQKQMSLEPVRTNRSQHHTVLLTLAAVVPMFFGLVIGALSLGSGLARALRAGSVCRDANSLAARGINLADPGSQSLILRTAGGLGLNLPGTASIPNPRGKAALILTEVVKVGRRTCAQGIANWNGDPATCPNYQKYVIASRIVIGNTSRWQSETGMPVSEPSKNGRLRGGDIASVIGNRALDLSAARAKLGTLKDDEHVNVAEVFADVSDLRVPYLIDVDTIRIRDIS